MATDDELRPRRWGRVDTSPLPGQRDGYEVSVGVVGQGDVAFFRVRFGEDRPDVEEAVSQAPSLALLFGLDDLWRLEEQGAAGWEQLIGSGGLRASGDAERAAWVLPRLFPRRRAGVQCVQGGYMGAALALAVLLSSGCAFAARARCEAYGYREGQVACEESVVPPRIVVPADETGEEAPATTHGACTEVDALGACVEREVAYSRSVVGYVAKLLMAIVQLGLAVLP